MLDLDAIRERSDRYHNLGDRLDDGLLPGLDSRSTGYAIGLSATLTAADVPDLLAAIRAVTALCDLADAERDAVMDDYQGMPHAASVRVDLLRKALGGGA